MSGIVCILKKVSLPVARSSTPRWPGQAMPPAGKRKAWEARLLPRVKIDGGPCVFLEVLIHVDFRINSQLMWIYPACFAQLLWHVAGELKHFSRNWPALGLCSAALSMRSEPWNGIWFTLDHVLYNLHRLRAPKATWLTLPFFGWWHSNSSKNGHT